MNEERVINIEKMDTTSFTKDLLDKIKDTGIGTFTKNDIYDYILFLANKYSSEEFLYKWPNYENAILFKVSEKKIKASIQNIALKYLDDTERKAVLDAFLTDIATKPNHIREKGDCFEFVLDNPIVRMLIENKLKTNYGVTLEYGINSERVHIEKAQFVDFLMNHFNSDERKTITILQKNLPEEISRKLKSGKDKFLSSLKEIGVEITVGVITNLIKEYLPTR
jgi:hypothetical protein